MKIFLSLLFLSVLFLSGCQWKNSQNRDQIRSSSDPSIELDGGFILLKKTEDALNVYRNEIGLFSFSLHESFRSLPPNESNQHSIDFGRKNKDQSNKRNRQTPNGFNTAVEDRLMVKFFPNDQGLTTDSSVEDFERFHAGVLPGQEIQSFSKILVGTEELRFNEETDGMGSVGHYFYFFTKKYIVMIGSDDVEKSELLEIAKSFKFE